MATAADLLVEHAASTVPATKSAHSLTLPNEVLSMIASECAPADLKNMRLASRLMHQVATKPFARKKFSRRRFIFTYQSMKALVDITAHPVFGPHLTCLTFGTYRMGKSGVNHDKYNDRAAQYDLKEAMHRAFLDEDHHIKMLTVALENLQKCHNTRVILGIYDDFQRRKARLRGYAFDASYQNFHAHWADGTRTLWAVLGARAESEYPLTALELCLSDYSRSLEKLVWDEDYAITKFLPQTYPNGPNHRLNADIHIKVCRTKGSLARLKILSQFTRLEVSKHCFGEPLDECTLMRFDENTYGAIWHAIESSQLQSISIDRSYVELEELERFLYGHSDSLRDLELHQVSTVVSGHYTTYDFLHFLKNHLNLEHLSIDEIFVEDGSSTTKIILPKLEKIVCDGERETIEGVDKLIQEVNEAFQDN